MEGPSLPARRPYAGRGRAGARSAWRRTRTGRLDSLSLVCCQSALRFWRAACRHGEPPSAGSPAAYSDASGNGRTRQILTVPSRLAEAIHSPSGLNATLSTQLVWPWRVRISLVAASHLVTIFTVESVLPQAITRSSWGWNATLCTAPVESGSSPRSFQVLASQTRTIRSALPEARSRPSPLNATDVA